MDIQKLSLKANGKSRACGKCPLGITNCNETIAKVCRDAFVEGYKKGYKQSKEDEKERIALCNRNLKTRLHRTRIRSRPNSRRYLLLQERKNKSRRPKNNRDNG